MSQSEKKKIYDIEKELSDQHVYAKDIELTIMIEYMKNTI